MKKKSFILLVMLLLSMYDITVSGSVQNNVRKPVPLMKSYSYNYNESDKRNDDGERETLGRSRGPIVIPKLSIEDYTLYYDRSLSYGIVEFIQDGEVVYEDTFSSSLIYDIPVFLTGSIEIRIYVGSFLYVGLLSL